MKAKFITPLLVSFWRLCPSFLSEGNCLEFKITLKWNNCFQFLCMPCPLLTTDSLVCTACVFWGLLLQSTLPSWSFPRDYSRSSMTAAFIPVSGLQKMCLGFPCKIPVHSVIGFDFECYAKKVFTTDGCLTLKGLGTLSFRTLFL